MLLHRKIDVGENFVVNITYDTNNGQFRSQFFDEHRVDTVAYFSAIDHPWLNVEYAEEVRRCSWMYHQNDENLGSYEQMECLWGFILEGGNPLDTTACKHYLEDNGIDADGFSDDNFSFYVTDKDLEFIFSIPGEGDDLCCLLEHTNITLSDFNLEKELECLNMDDLNNILFS